MSHDERRRGGLLEAASSPLAIWAIGSESTRLAQMSEYSAGSLAACGGGNSRMAFVLSSLYSRDFWW